MSDADLLREAARVLRERAEAATPGPWRVHEEHGRDMVDEGWSYIAVVDHGDGEVSATAYPGGGGNDDATANAAYIATMHPDVGLAVADWLDAEAAIWESLLTLKAEVTPQGATLTWGESTQPQAIAVARRILGGSSE